MEKIKLDCEDIATIIGVLESRLQLIKDGDNVDNIFVDENKRIRKTLSNLKKLGLELYFARDTNNTTGDKK